jgi:hypothetical protein
MCDYSLQHVQSRPAQVEDRLVTHQFGSTRGFKSVDDQGVYCGATAICLLPGTELAFEQPIEAFDNPYLPSELSRLNSSVAVFRQVNKEQPMVHHDALELPDGKVVLLHHLKECQCAKVLTLPAAPHTPEEAKEQERVAWAG